MIDPNTLKVGDKFYEVKERNTALSRSKIYQEIEGVEWFRYNRPVFTYSIVECTVLGIVKKTLDGIWDFDESSYQLEDEWYIEFFDRDNRNCNRTTYCDSFEFTLDNVFIDKSDALVYKEAMEQKAKEIDRK